MFGEIRRGSRAKPFRLASSLFVREETVRIRSILLAAGLVSPLLLSAMTPQQALAAPALRPLGTVVASPTDSAVQKVYYYRGRYYPYRYRGRYYAHRYYKGGHWRYY
jgi:hypothetical protein